MENELCLSRRKQLGDSGRATRPARSPGSAAGSTHGHAPDPVTLFLEVPAHACSSRATLRCVIPYVIFKYTSIYAQAPAYSVRCSEALVTRYAAIF